MATISRLTTWNTGDVLTAAALNSEFNNILTDYNGGITNTNISGSAAISYSKLALGGSIVNTDISSSAAIAYSKLNLSGGIVNADVSSSADIEASKILDTALTLTATQTASNKTFTKPVINGSVQGVTADSYAATIDIDLSASNIHTITLSGNAVLTVSNATVGQSFIIRLAQDGAGSRTVTWFTTLKWAQAAQPTLTTTANRIDTFAFLCVSSNNYDGYIVAQNIG